MVCMSLCKCDTSPTLAQRISLESLLVRLDVVDCDADRVEGTQSHLNACCDITVQDKSAHLLQRCMINFCLSYLNLHAEISCSCDARSCLSLTCTASLLPYFSLMNSSITIWDRAVRQVISSRHMMSALPKRVLYGKPGKLVDLQSPSSLSVFSRCLKRVHEDFFPIISMAASRNGNPHSSFKIWLNTSDSGKCQHVHAAPSQWCAQHPQLPRSARHSPDPGELQFHSA